MLGLISILIIVVVLIQLGMLVLTFDLLRAAKDKTICFDEFELAKIELERFALDSKLLVA